MLRTRAARRAPVVDLGSWFSALHTAGSSVDQVVTAVTVGAPFFGFVTLGKNVTPNVPGAQPQDKVLQGSGKVA
jgi:hypothetical protein